jgi:hypothetical protein
MRDASLRAGTIYLSDLCHFLRRSPESSQDASLGFCESRDGSLSGAHVGEQHQDDRGEHPCGRSA